MGKKANRSHELPALVAQTPVDAKVKVTVLRRGTEKVFTAKVGELTDRQADAENGAGSRESQGEG